MWAHEAPLVGRGAELAAIDRAIESVADGVPHGLALVGEPGIGKTALLRAACERSEAAGIPVLRGQAPEAELPFGMFVDALDGTFGRESSLVARLGEERLGELATVFPSLSGRGERAATGLQVERFRFYYAVHDALEQLASERPLALALDDVHWADASSIELLAYLLRRGVSAPLLLMFAYRPGQTPEQLSHAVASAARDARVSTLELGPLTAAEADELLGGDLDAQSRSALVEASGGNPFYLNELTRSTAIGARDGPDDLAEVEEPGAVPPRVKAAIAHELSITSDHARRLLEAAAVVGEPFEFELAAGVAELAEADALQALDELSRVDLIRTTEIPGRCVFRHPIVRRAVYESAGPGFTLAAHRRAAELLGRWGAAPAAQAHHVERSGRVGDQTAIALLTDAAGAAALRAPTTAARWLSSALRLLPTDAPPERRLELLIPLATALGTSGRIEDSRARLAEALPLLPDHEVVLKARLVGAMARLDHMVGRHGGARRLLEGALADAGDEPSAGSTALKVELAMDHWLADDWENTATMARAARADAEALDDRLSYATAAGLEAVGRSHLGQLEHARVLADEAAAVVDALPDTELAVRIEALVVLSHAEFGGIERASASVRHAERGIAISRATGQDSWYVLLTCERCVANLLVGRLAEAGEAAGLALESARLGHPQTQIWALTVSCWVDLLRGDLARAVEEGEEAVAIAERTETGLYNWLAYACLAMALLDAGHPARARDLILDHAGGPELELVDRGWLTHWYATLGLAELAMDNPAAARTWAERAQAAADEFPTRGRLGEASYIRAAVALAEGEPALAVRLALDAADGFAAAEWPVEVGKAHLLAGRAARAGGQPERAVELLRRAHAELDACGARGYRDGAARELRALGKRAARDGRRRAGTAAISDALSAREREVAELVARGMTNRQIADELVVSPKTVESHMTRILDKTGMPSRAALAAAVERSRRERGAQLSGS